MGNVSLVLERTEGVVGMIPLVTREADVLEPPQRDVFAAPPATVKQVVDVVPEVFLTPLTDATRAFNYLLPLVLPSLIHGPRQTGGNPFGEGREWTKGAEGDILPSPVDCWSVSRCH